MISKNHETEKKISKKIPILKRCVPYVPYYWNENQTIYF